jgi:PhzF family phenazine biosynthesis protein
MKYYIVDAFTDQPFGGNPAGVVLLPHGSLFPPDSLMVQIAAELRYSETAFVQPNGPREFTLRYFTPCGEVDLCGHATIAAFGLMLQEGIVAAGDECLNHTLAGDLAVTVGDQVMMQMVEPKAIHVPVDVDRLHHVMAGRGEAQWPDIPIEVISTGLPDIILPVDSLEQLDALAPDMDALAALSKELDVVGVHAFALADDGFTAHVRNFAPLYGIPEESATGTANAALTHYLERQGIIARPATCRFIQGEAMGRPSIITTMLAGDGTVSVGGTCRIIAHGNLLI